MKCTHNKLQVTESPNARAAERKPLPPAKLMAAACRNGRTPKALSVPDSAAQSDEHPAPFPFCFPAPLVLPGDCLTGRPHEGPQSLLSWINEKAKNPVTQRKKTVYVARAPTITDEVAFMKDWITPVGKAAMEPPSDVHVADYLHAFYHGVPVKLLPESRFTVWDEEPKRKKSVKKSPNHDAPYVGLAFGDFCTRIRTREDPWGVFPRQLNAADILDYLIEVVPKDAYAVVLLLDHDLYDEEEDEFTIGLAYGGSRVCVVSSARYHPELDEKEGIDREHMWPTSHCAKYVKQMCEDGDVDMDEDSVNTDSTACAHPETTPLGLAVKAAKQAASRSRGTPADLYGLWLSRMARTVSHEIGHCFGIGHCVYYACCMQGTSSAAEDARQPPYLCHVCLKKVTRAVLDVNHKMSEVKYVMDRDMFLKAYCKRWMNVPMFAGYEAWLDAMEKWRKEVESGRASGTLLYESYPAPLYGGL